MSRLSKFNEIWAEYRPQIKGYRKVIIREPLVDITGMSYILPWFAIRDDGLALSGQLRFTDLMRYNIQPEIKFREFVLQEIFNELRNRLTCGCKVWKDPETGQLFALECEKHIDEEQRNQASSRISAGTSGNLISAGGLFSVSR